MPDITLEEIQEKFDSLPENLRLAIIVAGADKKVNTIGREHGLNVRQISELLLKTHIVMFGFVHPDKFIEGVKDIAGIPPQVVKGIVRDINDQIFKDIREDLITLAEQPKKAEEVESFIQESTPGGTSLTPEELTGSAVITSEKQEAKPDVVGSPDASAEAFREDKKNDEILKSAGIEIPSLGFGNEIRKEKQTPGVDENKKNDEILKSAGIEIPSLRFGNVVGEKLPAQKEEVEKIALIKEEKVVEITPVVKEKIEEKEVDTKENAEVMKIAFEGLPKEDVVIPEFKVVEQQPSEEKKVSHDIYSTVTPQTKPEPVKTPEVVPPAVETKPEPAPAIEVPKPVEVPTPPVEKKAAEQPAPQPEAPKIVEPPVAEKNEPVPPEKQSEVTQTTEEKKKSEDLKLAVKNIIDIYQQKSKNPQAEVAYSNQEEEKRAIVMQIVEVQDSIKKMKDRLTQLTKEKTKLENDKKELANKDGKDPRKISEINTNLGDLAREEKMIQILRESILPKEYLDLLVKLDKLNTHNPPENAHK